ncbi:MAG TPA: hypothetical protein EYO85_03005 [Rhodospirillales bacterium]|nr:hypothetical protein [Rhodospirillales bacterium]
MAVSSRQIIAFHVGDRSGQSALALWKSIPERYRKHAMFYTDGWCAYESVIEAKQHRVVKKQKRITGTKIGLLSRTFCLLKKLQVGLLWLNQRNGIHRYW